MLCAAAIRPCVGRLDASDSRATHLAVGRRERLEWHDLEELSGAGQGEGRGYSRTRVSRVRRITQFEQAGGLTIVSERCSQHLSDNTSEGVAFYERPPRRMEGSRLLGGEVRSRSTLAGVLLPVALAVIVAKSSFLAFPRAALDSRSPTALLQIRLEQRVRAFARQQGGRQRLLKLATHRDRRRAIGARLTMLADPDEAVLRAQMGRGWTYRGDAHVGSSAGGPGMPLTASYAMTADDLKKQQFKKVVRQRQFEDFVVDGRTGRPIDLSDEEKKELQAHMMADEAKEQEDVDAFSDPFQDAQIPSQYIYPDGESVIPKESNIEIRGLSDKHVMANGTITEHQGPLAGIFREGSFGDGLNSTHRFDKIGEEIGFTDRPLSIRDVDYAKIRDDRLKALEMRENETEAFRIARINGTEHKFYCSGKECDDQWGIVGDQVLAALAPLPLAPCRVRALLAL